MREETKKSVALTVLIGLIAWAMMAGDCRSEDFGALPIQGSAVSVEIATNATTHAIYSAVVGVRIEARRPYVQYVWCVAGAMASCSKLDAKDTPKFLSSCANITHQQAYSPANNLLYDYWFCGDGERGKCKLYLGLWPEAQFVADPIGSCGG